MARECGWLGLFVEKRSRKARAMEMKLGKELVEEFFEKMCEGQRNVIETLVVDMVSVVCV